MHSACRFMMMAARMPKAFSFQRHVTLMTISAPALISTLRPGTSVTIWKIFWLRPAPSPGGRALLAIMIAGGWCGDPEAVAAADMVGRPPWRHVTHARKP